MRRKLIQIGKSTLLLSAPREWVKQNSLSKGDEVEVDLDNDKLTIWCDSRAKKEKLSVDVAEFMDMLPRLLFSIYRSGVDELELRYDKSSVLDKIKSVIWKEAVGFEILEESSKSCTIVNVSGKMEDFQKLLRRLFHVTLTMGTESLSSLKKNSGFENILYLEQENNRLATVLVRAMNKYGSFGFKKIGPLYYIVQELERIGDQYKYVAAFFMQNKKQAIRPHVLKLFEYSCSLFRSVYELLYSFAPEKINDIGAARKKLIGSLLLQQEQKLSTQEQALLQHSLNIATRSFDMISSITILRL